MEYILLKMLEHPFMFKSGWDPEIIYCLSLALKKAKSYVYKDGYKIGVKVGNGCGRIGSKSRTSA